MVLRKMQEATYKTYSKGLSGETPGEVIRSQKWVAARRGWLKYYPDRVTLGDWDVSYSEVDQVILYKGWTFPIPVKVLELVTGDTAYQFGINGWCRPEKVLPESVQIKPLSLGYSPFSLVVRIILLAGLVYWLWA